MCYHNIGDVGTKEITMTDIAIQCTTHDNTSGNVHVITVQSIQCNPHNSNFELSENSNYYCTRHGKGLRIKRKFLIIQIQIMRVTL